MNFKSLLIILAGAILISIPLSAQEYVYPNKRVTDEGLLEYRPYTLEEARAYEKGLDSFEPLILDGWSEERRLTEDESAYAPKVVTVGYSIFCTYCPISSPKPYFIRSLNNGLDWDNNLCLMDSSGYPGCFFSEILTNSNQLFIGFTTQYAHGFNCLNYFKSTDWGVTWSAIDTVLPYYSEDFLHYSSFCNVGPRIYASYVDSYHDSIKVVTSLNWGQTWNGFGRNVAYLAGTPQPMTVRASGDNVYLVWVNEVGTVSCRYSRSTDRGQTWSDEVDISNDSLGAQRVYVAVHDTHVVVCWMGYKYSPYSFTGDLFIKQSFDNGETWGEEQVLTDLHKVWMGTIFIEDSLIVAAWQDTRFDDSNDEAIVRYSLDYGITWTAEERLSYGDYHSNTPIACETESRIHILWGDQRAAAPGLYYANNDLITGIDNNNPLPEKHELLSSYPNPFNSTTVISYSNLEGGEIEVYDITGRLVTEIDCGGCQEGKVTWDATAASGEKVCTGIYFARARTTQGYLSSKLIYLK